MDIADILKLIKPLKNRIHLNRLIYSLMVGLAGASILCFILAYLALILPIPFLGRIIAVTYLSSTGISLVVSIFLRPNDMKSIRTADSLGLKERLVTAYQLRDDSSPIARIQRYDALKIISKVDFKALYPLKFPMKLAFISLIFIILIPISFAIPSKSKELAADMENLLNEIKTQAAKLDQERKELAKSSNLSEKKLQEINKKIDELLKELKKSTAEGEAIKALSKAKHEMDDLKSQSSKDELSKLADSLMDNPATRAFAEDLKKGDLSQIEKKLEQTNENIKKLDSAGKKLLSEQIKKAAQEISQSKELAQNLANLSDSIASGNLGSIRDEIMALNDTISEMAEEDQELADAMEEFENEMLKQLGDSIDGAKRRISAAAGGKKRASQNDGKSSQSGDGQGGNPQQGTGSGNGQGKQGGNQPGSGQSNKGGSGAGDGSSDRDLGYSGEESGTGSKNPGEKKVKDYESVYVPERIGGDNTESYLKGQRNISGQSQWSDGNAPVEKGKAIPYDRVLGDYKSEAMSSMQESAIPPVMKDIVRDYFSSLE